MKRNGPQTHREDFRQTGSRQGFTLLELLIAMGLLVLLVAIMMGALRLSSRSVAAGERTMESHERFRAVTAVLDAQIQSQLPLTYDEEGENRYYFRGGHQALRLATSSSIWGGVRGYVIVDYRVEAGPDGKQRLQAWEESPGMVGTRETSLFTGATEIFFEYYRGGSDEEPGLWETQWDDETTLPEKIRLRVNQGARTFDLQFPVRARGKKISVALAPASGAGGVP